MEMTCGIPGFAEPAPWIRQGQELREALRGRWYFWVSGFLLRDESFAKVKLPDGWAIAYEAFQYDTYLVVREPALPLVKLWCWFWSTGQWLPFVWAMRAGMIAHVPGRQIDPLHSWRPPWKWWATYFANRSRHPWTPSWAEWKTARSPADLRATHYWPERALCHVWNWTRVVMIIPPWAPEPHWRFRKIRDRDRYDFIDRLYLLWPLNLIPAVRRWANR